MNLSENKLAREAIITLCLAATGPDDKVDLLTRWAKDKKEKLVIEIEKYLISEADRLIDNREEFDLYFKKFCKEHPL